MLLYDAAGRPLQTRESLPAVTIRALVEGESFVRTAHSVLPPAHLEPYCLRCAGDGRDAAVVLTPDVGKTLFRCGCRAGHIVYGRSPDLGKLLFELDWNIRCTTCRQPAQGDNGKGDAVFAVSCECTRREHTNPLASVPPLAS